MSRMIIVLGAATLVAFATTVPSQAVPKSDPPGWSNKPPKHDPHGPRYDGAPGPEVGVGLPVLATVGGYLWYMRRRRRQREASRLTDD